MPQLNRRLTQAGGLCRRYQPVRSGDQRAGPNASTTPTAGENEFMATRGTSKSNQQPAIQANVSRILAELHQLAAANASRPLANCRSGGSIPPAMVIRGK